MSSLLLTSATVLDMTWVVPTTKFLNKETMLSTLVDADEDSRLSIALGVSPDLVDRWNYGYDNHHPFA